MKEKFAIGFSKDNYADAPNHLEYGFVVNGLKAFLNKEIEIEFPVVVEEDNQEEVWDLVQEDLRKENPEIQILGHVYDSLETVSIRYVQTKTGQHVRLRPTLNNTIFYYPTYRIVLVKVRVFQNHTDYDHDLILAPSNEDLLHFIEYVLKGIRQAHQNQLTLFIDTENGVERERQTITSIVSREDVMMEPHLKTEIYRTIDEFFNESRSFFTQYDIPYKRGILLYGHPGNGKTTLVKSIAGSLTAPVAYWQITEHTSSYSIKEVFSAVNKMAPMVLVIEDIDSMPESVRSFFLNTLDGATSKEGIFLIGTTNYPEKIDPALINRAGRFDRAYEIKNPNADIRLTYLRKRKLGDILTEEEIFELAQQTDGFSIAQLNELYTSVALQWHYEQHVNIRQILKDLQSTNQKNKNQDWMSDYRKLGFS